MFDQKKYINNYIKDNYRTFKIRIRNDDNVILHKLDNIDNKNRYILDLIRKDIYDNRKYNYINDDIKIEFELSITMKDLVNKAEEADLLEDYGLYMNIVDAIDTQGKKETKNHIITESEWNKLIWRYCL